jgi:hypothetical protein
VSMLAALLTYGLELSVDVHDLHARRCNNDRRCHHRAIRSISAVSTVSAISPACGAPRNAGVAQWRERTPDDSVCLGHERPRFGL